MQSSQTSSLQDGLKGIIKKYRIEQEDKNAFHKSIGDRKIQQCFQFVAPKKKQELRKDLINLLGDKYFPLPRQIKINYQGRIHRSELKSQKQFMDDLERKYQIKFNITEYILEIDNETLNDLKQIFQKQTQGKELKIIRKKKILYTHKGQQQQVWSSIKSLMSIKKEILKDIKQKYDEDYYEKAILLHIREKIYKGDQDIQNILLTDIGQIKVEIIIEISVFFENHNKKYQIGSLKPIQTVKKMVSQDFHIEQESQKYCVQNQGKKNYLSEMDMHKNIQSLLTKKNTHLQLVVQNTHTSQYYGFHKNQSQRYNNFKNLNLEDEEHIKNVIKQCNFEKEGGQWIFLEVFLKLLFVCMKKKFCISTVIDNFRNLVFQNQNKLIWRPLSDQSSFGMNEYFVFMYLLRNSDSRLKLEIMKLVKGYLPLPMYINEFQTILKPSLQLKKNEELIWVLRKGITLGSVGLHTNGPQQHGKSDLLNELFYLKFVKRYQKHKILQKIPYICIQVYDELFPLNVIDIPSDCDEKIKYQVLGLCDIILVQSWQSEENTESYKKKLRDKFINIPIICFRRDVKGSRIQEEIKDKNLLRDQNILLSNLKNKQISSDYINSLRIKVNYYLHSINEKKKVNQSEKILTFTSNEEFSQLTNIVSKFKQHSAQYTGKNLCQARKSFIQFFSSTKFPKQCVLDYTSQYLRQIQKEKIKQVMKIYKYQRQIQEIQKQKFLHNPPHQKIAELSKYLKHFPYKIQKQTVEVKQKQNVLKIIANIITSVQTKIKPKIISIQNFWRGLFQFYDQENQQIPQKQDLNELILSMKKIEVLGGQPFEIMNGDNQKIPKNIMKQTFSTIDDRCPIISVIGPQSSGKSTLLNFLFGCDFAASEGRCTKGIYGTYLRFRDRKINNFEGIFIVDTQGLFTAATQTFEEQRERQKFDSKLILFCLAISDMVIVNVRGNIDNNVQKMLRICNKKLDCLQFSQKNKPQVVMVLNQNNTCNTQEYHREFNKISQYLPLKITKSLSNAYEIKNYSKEQVSLLLPDQILSRRYPQNDFYKHTKKLLEEIVQLLNKRIIKQTLKQKIQYFSMIWNVITAFPNLSQTHSQEYVEKQQKIKQWKKQQNYAINEAYEDIILSVQDNCLTEGQAKKKLNDIYQKYLKEYSQKFIKTQQTQELAGLIREQKFQIQSKMLKSQEDLNRELQKMKLKQKIEAKTFEGYSNIQKAEMKIIQDQKSKLKMYKQAEKEEIFQKTFGQLLEKIKEICKDPEISQRQYSRIRGIILHEIRNSGLKQRNFELPQSLTKEQIKQIQLLNIQQAIQYQIRQITQNGRLDYSNLMIYTEKPYNNTLKGINSDAKLKFFNIKDYFQTKIVQKQISLKQQIIQSSFNIEDFIQIKVLQEVNNIVHEESKQKQILFKILEEVSNELQQNLGIKITNIQNLFPLYCLKTKFNHSKIVQNYLQNELKIQIQIVGKPKIHHQPRKKEYLQKLKKIKYGHDRFESGKNFANFIFKPIYQIQKILVEDIVWKNIQFSIIPQQQLQMKELEERKSKEREAKLYSTINADLEKINLQIPQQINLMELCLSEKASHEKSEQIFRNIKIKDQSLQYEQNRKLSQGINSLIYFSKLEILAHLKKAKNVREGYISIGRQKVIEYVPKNEYFNQYNTDDIDALKIMFEDIEFKKYIFKELSPSIRKIMEQISTIIKEVRQKMGHFNDKAVIEVFHLVNQEITQFNNDLNQICYKLSPLFVGKVFVFAINLMLKIQVQHELKVHQEPYRKKIENKESEKQKFLNRVSNDKQKIYGLEATQFLQKLVSQFQKLFRKRKQALFSQSSQEFRQKYDLLSIQKKIDSQIFDSRDNEQILEYIENPYNFISKQYDNCYQKFAEEQQESYQKQNISQSVCNELKEAIIALNSQLKEKGINQSNSSPGDILQDAKNERLFEHFIDLITGQKQSENTKIKLCPTKLIQNHCGLFQNLKKSSLEISNLWVFLEKINLYTLKTSLKDKQTINNHEKKEFINKIRVFICRQKCPCCGRICDMQGESHIHHQCQYGHQIRAMAGNYIIRPNETKQACVSRCEQMQQTDLIQFNGEKKTWTEFKKYQIQKQRGGWSYEKTNLEQNPEYFKNIWKKVGRVICEVNKIIYVDENKFERNNIQQQTHIIYAISSSLYLKGEKWENLLAALNNALDIQKRIPHTKASVLNFSFLCKLVYERVNPQEIQSDQIQFMNRGNILTQVFKKARDLIQQHINNQKVVFVLMTGYKQYNYPERYIQNIQEISAKHPGKFSYSSICLEQNVQELEQINLALNGRNIFAGNTLQGLIQAYETALEVVRIQENDL